MKQLVTWQQTAGAFARRYETRRGMPWAYGPHVQHLTDIAEWCNLHSSRGGDPKKIAAKLLDNWFDLKWAMKVDYKPRFLAENLGSVYNPPVVPVEDEPNEDAINARRLKQRRIQEQSTLEQKLQGHSETAAKPPALDELLGKIGRKL